MIAPATIARVALDLPLPELFDYALSADSPICPGDWVIVPWGRSRRVGLVAALTDSTTVPSDRLRMLEERLPGHGEPVDELQSRGILLDGSTEDGDTRLLLQIFSQTMIGPVFFEFIQRKKDEGFGEGNFTALFKSIERDQIERGALQVKEPAA